MRYKIWRQPGVTAHKDDEFAGGCLQPIVPGSGVALVHAVMGYRDTWILRGMGVAVAPEPSVEQSSTRMKSRLV